MRWLDGITGHEFEQALEVGDGQGSLACYSLWVRKGLDTQGDWTELNWTNAGDAGVDLSPGSGRSPAWGHDNWLQYSCLENPMDRATWQATVWMVQSLTQLSSHAHTQKFLGTLQFIKHSNFLTQMIHTAPMEWGVSLSPERWSDYSKALKLVSGEARERERSQSLTPPIRVTWTCQPLYVHLGAILCS